jgi:aspartate/methionine/tyrosine aminotransferase
MSTSSVGRPFGHSVWAAPYLSSARHVLGSSVVAPLTLGQLCALAYTDPATLLDPDAVLDYGPSGGSAQLREAIVEEMPGLHADSIAVTSGAGDGLAVVAQLVCRPGSHVIVQVPTHESVLATIERSGCRATTLRAPIHVEDVADCIQSNTSAAFLASPHNPTGQVLGESELRSLAQDLSAVGALLVVDEVFRGVPLAVGTSPPPAAAVATNAVSIGALSKVYGLPGLRVGWVAGPLMLVDDVHSFQRYTSRCPPRTSEAIALVAFACRQALLARARALVYDAFVELNCICDGHDAIRLAMPDGGISAFPELDVEDVDRWCAEVVERHGLLLAPGNACFGIPGRVRINLALEPEVRSAAFPVLARALAETPRRLKGSAR